MEFIDLSKENYKDYLPLDIAAFNFAFAGAMGDAGGVVIITTDGQVYYFNYVYQDFSKDDSMLSCPFFHNANCPSLAKQIEWQKDGGISRWVQAITY